MSLRAGGLTGLMNQPSAQVIDGSVRWKRLVGGGTAAGYSYLTRTLSAGNRKTWTISFWVKRGHLGGADNDEKQKVIIATTGSSNGDYFSMIFSGVGGEILDVTQYLQSTLKTNRVFRNPNAWMHILVSYDVDNATASDRAQLYINGVRETSFSTSNISTMSGDYGYNRAAAHYIGVNANVQDRQYFDGQLSQFYSIDGQALGPEYFGFTDPLTGTWRPKKFSGDYTIPASGTVYSSYGSGTVSGSRTYDKAFDGSTSTFCEPSDNQTITFDFTSLPGGGITVGSSLRMYLNKAGTPAAGHFTVNGTNLGGSVPSGGWLTINSVSRLDTITFYHQSGSSSVELYAVEVDGSILTDGTTAQGTNSFYLPMDGNSPIGQDKSGQGNDWTPVNFGGSNSLEKATGALPILNTDGGGNVARAGVFGSEVGAYYAVTVPSGTGGGFYLDGTQKPALSLIRGATYTFDQSDSSNSGHPLVFGTTADGNNYSDGVTTNGTPGSAGAYTKITVPHNAPDTLYYHCSAHGGMGSSTSQTTDTKKADPYAWKNTLALPLVGSSADVSNQINSGSTIKTITANGNAAASSTQSNFYGGSFIFDGTGDYLAVTNTSDLVFGTGAFTIECWIYAETYNSVTYPTVISKYDDGDASWILRLKSDGDIVWYDGNNNESTTQPIPLNEWIHLAVVREGTGSNQTKVYVNGVLHLTHTDSSNYDDTNNIYIGRQDASNANEFDGYIQDVRIYKGVAKYTSNFIPASTDPDILPDTPSGVSGSSKLAKITDGAVSFDGSGDYLSGFGGSAILPTSTGTAFVVDCFWYSNGNSSQKGIWEQHSSGSGRTAYFVNNGSAYLISEGNTVGTFTYGDKRWYFTRIIYDGSGNIYHYVDGVLIGSDTQSSGVDNTGFQIGAFSTDCFNGFISNFRIVVGSNSLSGTDVPTAPLTNITNTSLLCCQSPTSATAFDVSPGTITANGDVAATNFNPFNTDINTVRGQETGYATMNPLAKGSNLTLSNGNLDVSSSGHSTSNSTIPVTSGTKVYVEAIRTGGTSAGGFGFTSNLLPYSAYPGQASGLWYVYDNGTNFVYNFEGSYTQYGSKIGTGDCVQLAIDYDAGKAWIGIDNTWFTTSNANSGNPYTGENPTFTFSTSLPLFPLIHSAGFTWSCNFGQKPFKFPPPEGFQPLNAANVRPSTVIARPDQYFGVTTYAGNATTQHIDVGLRPDFVWIKERTDTGGVAHYLGDTVRGINKNLQSNTTQNEGTNNIYGYVSSVDDNGFTVTQGSNDSFYTNGNPETYVAWCWKAGGNKNTFNVDDVGYASASAAGITDGTISLTGASVGTRQGFSIIKYTGSGSNGTIAHGLSQAPDFFFGRDLEDTGGSRDWIIYHKSIGATGRLKFTDAITSTASAFFQNIEPTSSLITVGTSNDINSTNDYVLYCWHNVPGLQKFGKYTGNGDTTVDNGPFVELGFRPALVAIKRLGTGNWIVYDHKRHTVNPLNGRLYWNTTQANTEQSGYNIDFLSNGFKITGGNNDNYNAASDYVYAAWAEAPSFNLYGGQSNAR